MDTFEAVFSIAAAVTIIFLISLVMGGNPFNWQGGKSHSASIYASAALALVLPVIIFSGSAVLAYYTSIRSIAIDEEKLFVKYSWNRIECVRWTEIQDLRANLWGKQITDKAGNHLNIAWMSIKLGHKDWLSIDIDAAAAKSVALIYEKETGRKYDGNLDLPGIPAIP